MSTGANISKRLEYECLCEYRAFSLSGGLSSSIAPTALPDSNINLLKPSSLSWLNTSSPLEA